MNTFPIQAIYAIKFWFTDYVRRENIDCRRKISGNHSTLSEAMRSCSRDSNCFGVSQPCSIDIEMYDATKDTDKICATEKQIKSEYRNYSTCGELYSNLLKPQHQNFLLFEDCKSQIFYQKSILTFSHIYILVMWKIYNIKLFIV